MNKLLQIQIETEANYQKYLKDFFEEPVSFEQYINFVLGQLFDEGHHIKSVTYFPVKKEVCITFYMTI